MSRENIASMGWVSRSEFHVVFNARNGERTYSYSSAAGIAIMGGADPSSFPAEEVSGLGSVGSLVEDLEDIAELGEIAAL